MTRSSLAADLGALGYLVRRALGVFLKDKLSVFLALLSPLIVLVLYIFFLGDLQTDSLLAYFPAGTVDESAAQAFVDSWMIAGVLGTATITVSFSANSVMVGDRERGVLGDFLAAPVKKSVLLGGYFVFNFVVTVVICAVVFLIGLVYLAASGSFFMSAADVFAALGTVLFAALSATLISVLVCAAFPTQGALGGFAGIVSAAIGFLIGAYMPLGTFPDGVEYAAGVLPGTHAAGLFRNFFMRGALENLTVGLPEGVSDEIAESFSMTFGFFGAEADIAVMAGYVAGWITLTAVLGLVLGTRLLDLPAGRSRSKKRPAAGGADEDQPVNGGGK